MDQSWTIVYSSFDLSELEIIRSFLLDNEIDAIVLNKQDSMYVNLNSISPVELFVKNDDVIKAKHLIEKQFNNE